MAVYQRVTLGQIKGKLKARTDGVGAYWKEEEMRYAINEGLRLWQALTGQFYSTITTPITSLVTYVEVPKQLSSVFRLSHSGVPLTNISLPELDYGNPGWEGTSGTPLYFAPTGTNLVALSPSPSSGTLTWEGPGEAPQLLNDGDYINIGDEELTRFLDYCLEYMAFKEGAPELEAAGTAMGALVEAASLKNAHLRQSQFYRIYMGKNREEVEGSPTSIDKSPGVRG